MQVQLLTLRKLLEKKVRASLVAPDTGGSYEDKVPFLSLSVLILRKPLLL